MTRDSRHWAYRLISYFTDVTLETVRSEISGNLQVRLVNGRTVLDSSHANYSYGSLHKLFQKVFRQLGIRANPPASLLLLGLGGGSVVSIIRDEYGLVIPITAVEADPEVIRLARDRFGIEKYRSLNIVNSDAGAFMHSPGELYEMIIVDLFVDNTVPEVFTSLPFLNDCNARLGPGGVIVFNFILQDPKQKAQHSQFLGNMAEAGLAYIEKRFFATNRVLFLRHA